MRRWIMIFLISLLPMAVFAEEVDQDSLVIGYSQAEEAFRSGKFNEAERHLLALLDEGMEEPAIYHDLGQIYRSKEMHGYAYAAYLQALRLNPRYSPSRNALKEMGEDILPLPVKNEELLAGLAVLNILGAWALLKRRRKLVLGIFLVLLVGGCALVTLPTVAVVLADGVPTYTSPELASETTGKLSAATQVKVKEINPEWVRTSAGWVRSEDLQLIR